MPTNISFNSGNHSVSDMKIRALCPIFGSNDSRKKHEMRLISRLGTAHTYMVLMNFFLCLAYPFFA
jgi:hypothetical protein